ncbi:MAG: hypothetical protein K6G16_03815 [Lachnospiraceae bacterium]|nr:hypothetical protein [Lachnospiraceae bacterium]
MDHTKEFYHRKFKQYTDTLREIRMLSTSGLSKITSAEDYSQVLLSNFRRIGKLAEGNRQVIDGVLMPLLGKEEPLSEEEREALGDLIGLLVDADYGEEIDAHISRLAMERLARDHADEEELFSTLADDERVAALDREVENCYTLMDIYLRGNPGEADIMRRRGLKALRGLLDYLDRERFAALSMGSRMTVMVDSYYGALLYENDDEERSDRYFTDEFDLLVSSLALVDDPFYRKLLPDTEYNWQKHTFGALFYMGRMSLSRSITKERAQKIFAGIREMETLWKDLADVIGNKISLYDVRLLLLRVARLAEDPQFEELFARLREDYLCRDVCDYSNSGMDINLDVPEGYLNIVRDAAPTEEAIERYRSMTQAMLSYLFSMPKKENLGNCMTVYSGLIREYTEYPGA